MSLIATKDAYNILAPLYNQYQEEISPKKWAAFLHHIYQQQKSQLKEKEVLLDLGCGTARITFELEKLGYQTVGVDFSEEMLAIAAKEKAKQKLATALIQSDIITLNLKKEVDLVISTLDTLNHIITKKDLKAVFQNVARHLKAEKFFIFDVCEKAYYQDVLADQTFYTELGDEAVPQYIIAWENQWLAKKQLSQSDLTILRKLQENIYEHQKIRIEERYYNQEELIKLAKYAQMDFVASYKEPWQHKQLGKVRRFYVFQKRAIED